ncbi:Putative metal chaperone YciC [Methanimicrococcus hongohii]|uniref:Metal chaperone YciC n=1 Tax=Methanimicrococcus hongohii TaxID=3028295 RepID=A0AA96ZTC5_9EURY|nr:GTP-binding protein [Methanimicrococcus sp. Hf6]WNY24410.1 Putative metal chaperone YciC [Methanimicrococcus sp. Hf6]
MATANLKNNTLIVIIGGFLGSGKTTLIKELGKFYASSGKVVTYFTNEVGEEVIDGDLLGYDMDANEITTACVTCNLKEVMSASVEQLIERAHPDVLFIEPKETVSPLVVKDELEKVSLKSGAEEYNFAPLFTLIDCSVFFKNVKEKKKITFDQISVSEVIVLNKTDLIPENELSLVEESVRQINQDAKILKNSIQNKKGMDDIIKLIEI